MLQHAVALLLQRLLGKFVSFDASMLRLSLWQGDLAFHNLGLRLSYGEGAIGALQITIPWRALWSQPVVLRASGIRILLHQSHTARADPTAAAAAMASSAEEAVAEALVGGNDAGDDGSTDRTYLSRLVTHLLANIQIELTDVQVRYDCVVDEHAVVTRPCSASLEVASIALINANADWELAFTPQSNAIMQSRKRMNIEGITAFVTHDEQSPATTTTTSPTGTLVPPPVRHYLFHEWFAIAKATLTYPSKSAAFPDVELALEIGATPPGPSAGGESVCAHCGDDDALFGDAVRLPPRQPRIHVTSEHIDVFYAILMEVKAPYEEYERLTAFTQRQSSRPEGFLMVLSYARQWLLADCLDGIATDKRDKAPTADSDDDSDEDEFEDAITPPTLTIRASLQWGFSLVMLSRGYELDVNLDKRRLWVWSLGATSASMKQSCVEDEIHITIADVAMHEIANDPTQTYAVFFHAPTAHLCEESTTPIPFLAVKCIVPAYQSRLVGHQPVTTVTVNDDIMFAIRDETLVMWMTLFAPVYQWWNRWNATHPRRPVLHVTDNRIAPISQLSLDIKSFSLLFSVRKSLCFGFSLDGVRAETVGKDDDRVHSDFDVGELKILSGPLSLFEALQGPRLTILEARGCHEIARCAGVRLSQSSDSRTGWSLEAHQCNHNNEATDELRENGMYQNTATVNQIALDIYTDEIEAFCWLMGKWSFFLPDPVEAPQRNSAVDSSTQLLCKTQWTVHIPRVSCAIHNRNEDNQTFCLQLEDAKLRVSTCTRSHEWNCSAASLVLKDDVRTLIQATGSPRSSVPGLAVSQGTLHHDCENMRRARSAISVYQLELCWFLPSVLTMIQWFSTFSTRFELGFLLATAFGYSFEEFKRNLARQKPSADSNRDSGHRYEMENQVHISVLRSCRVVVLHKEVDNRMGPKYSPPQEIGCLEFSSLGISMERGATRSAWKMRGSVKSLQIMDLSFPREVPSFVEGMPNRHFISSNQTGSDGSIDMSLRNSIDFSLYESAGTTRIQVRLDSVNAVYLHRVYKQFHHYISDHLTTLWSHRPRELRQSMSTHARSMFTAFHVDEAELPVSVEELVSTQYSILGQERLDTQISSDQSKPMVFEIVANELVFSLPRSSFSSDSIVLTCTNARFWTSGIDPNESVFLETGMFERENRGSLTQQASDVNLTKVQQLRRTDLRNLRRLIKNQRSRMLSNRSQLFVDLKNATQNAQNYLHEGFEALPAAEEAVKSIHSKILALEKDLEQLNGFLRQVDDAIEVANASVDLHTSSTRDSLQLLVPTSTTRDNGGMTAETIELMEDIRKEVMGMSQQLMAPIFVADDAEFHDARLLTERSSSLDNDMSSSATSLFEFELIDMSGSTSNSTTPLFHHALLTGRIESIPESINGVLSSFINIDLAVNELSVGARPEQYEALLGVIFENFKEVSSVVNEDTYPLCTECDGHHFDDYVCQAVWLKIPVHVADAALRVSRDDRPVADFLFEQLELSFTLRTDDSLEIYAATSSFSAIDVRPNRCDSAVDVFRPLEGDGAQIEYTQLANWTDTSYCLTLRNTSCLLLYPVMCEVLDFFVTPIVTPGNFFEYEMGYMCSPPPNWKKMDFSFGSSGCSCALLEDFSKTNARALVLLSSIDVTYSACQSCEDVMDMTKCHVSVDQHGIFFSQLPDLQIDVSFPLSNAFMLVFDHLVEGTNRLYRRNSFVLAPVEARFSVQDGLLFCDIINNYLHPPKHSSNTKPDRETEGTLSIDVVSLDGVDLMPSSRKMSVAAPSPPLTFAVDKLLGDVGELRFVMVNNSLGIPIADFQVNEIVCEYIQDEDYSVVVGAILALNYFNNSIYRWEPLIEPFVWQVRVHRGLEENSKMEVFANLPNTVNLNLTPAMAPLLSSDALKQADFVTTGSKSTAPFWIVNRTGDDLKFSFRRGFGTVIQQSVPDGVKVSVDCREQGDMRSFDSASADKFLRLADSQALTVNHTLSVWLNDSKWVSANPVIVDVVGHISVPLREASTPDDDLVSNGDSECSPPILVAEITIQPDGSKLISLHSQVVLQNRTSIPLMVWAFSPRDNGVVQEWVVDREQTCYIPIHLIHPQSKISVRPSPYVQYAPLATSLEELGDDARPTKSIHAKRFIRSGTCNCNFETFVSLDDYKKVEQNLATTSHFAASPLSGYVVQDLPTWKCMYDVEAYSLMRATFSIMDEDKAPAIESGTPEPIGEEEEVAEDVDNEFLNVFSESRGLRRRMPHPLRKVNEELEEVRAVNQRRGLYEATNSNLFHLSVAPFITLHNRLAAAVAYRLLNQSLQLVGEGILSVGAVLPLFQVDPSQPLYISFRLENYNWSAPRQIVNPKHPAYNLPYKELIEPVDLQGRVFNREVAGEQGNVPNLQLQVKLTGRDIIVFCSIWIVNHSGLDLEYCNSTSTSSRRLDAVLKYVHKTATTEIDASGVFTTRTMSFRDDLARDVALTRLQKVKSSINPVAVIVVVDEASNLYNSQYFGAQSPYVRASLYILKNVQDRFLEKPEMIVYSSGTTKPSPSGGTNPKWDTKLQNTMLLRLPEDSRFLEKARMIFEVRNVRYGMDSCLGVTAIKLETILKNRDHSAGFNWYKLLKRKSSKEKKASGTSGASTNVHRGDIRLSFSVGTKQELQSEYDDGLLDTPESRRSPLCYDEGRSLTPSPAEVVDGASDSVDPSTAEVDVTGFLPTSGAIRSMQRLQTPSTMVALPYLPMSVVTSTVDIAGAPASRRARQNFMLSEVESTRSNVDIVLTDPMSTRAVISSRTGISPPKTSHGGKLYPIQVYLPQNRFAFVVVEVTSAFLMQEVFDLVCSSCGFQGILDSEDFSFYELLLPRFISLRSAGRPEGERWYGPRILMDSKIEKRGRQFGLHLCHKLAMSTIRLYDEHSTASQHHMTPRSLLSSSQRINPAQNRPVMWGASLLYGGGGRNWDVLRVRSHSSTWSEVVRLNRNAMGNSGVAQVITLTNEVYDQDESSDLRRGSQEIALWSTFGSGRFSETIVATIVPRYILINRTGDTIKYRQVNAPQTFQLSPNELVAFHWPSASKDKLLEVTLLHGYTWSGSFRIYSLGTTYLKLRDSNDASRIYILQCQIEMVGGSIALVFREESKRFPPYRIDNMTSFRIQFKQSSWGSDGDYDELQPRSSCAYSWDLLTGNEKHSAQSAQDPTFLSQSNSSTRTLQIRFMRVTSSTGRGNSNKDAVETREYHLDEMTSHKRIQLQRSLPSQLFVKPDHKGYLQKKDNLLKWAKRYFRLYEHMLYYFATEQDQELLGVIDLRSGSEAVPGAGGVAIFEKAADTPASKGGGFISLNGLVSSIFGSSSQAADSGGGSDDDDDDDHLSALVQVAVNMTASSLLCEKSEKFGEKLAGTGDPQKIKLSRAGFFVNGHDVVEFLLLERHARNESEALARADEMVQMNVLQPLIFGKEFDAKKSPTLVRFQYSKIVWYTVNSISLAEDRDSMDSSDDTPNSTLSTPTPSRAKSISRPKSTTQTTQFSIITTTKCYELKSKSPKEAKIWIRKLRRAARARHPEIDESTNELPRSRSQQSIGPAIQNAKTYVHVRVRADGPTKVLELYEGGEEEADERDIKHELSSLASVSSSPTASETSTNTFDSLTNGIAINVRVEGFGISCVNEVPVELVYIYLGGINVHYSRANSKMRLKVTLDDIQIDNQTSDATFSKLLCPRMDGDIDVGERTRSGSGDSSDDISVLGNDDGDEGPNSNGLVANSSLFSCADCRYRQASIASMHFCCTWSNEQGTTDYFEHCSFWLYPVIMQLDEELVVAAKAFLSAMGQSSQQTQTRTGEIRMKSIPIEVMTDALNEYKENTSSEELNPLASLATTISSSSAEVRKVYFALLHIHPIELDITYRSDVFQATTTIRLREAAAGFKAGVHRLADDPRRTASMPSSSSGASLFDFDSPPTSQNEGDKNSSSWAIPSLAMHVPDLDNAPVRLSALMIEHAFGTSGDLTRRVTKYYTRQMWKQLHKILGSFDFLGNPVGFLDHIGTGVRDFVYEPLEGLKVGGKGFSKGLAKGTASLVSNTLDGTFDAASKISGTFGQGLANLSLDDHYQQIRARARRHHVRGIKEGLIQGSKELSLGVYEGVAGLVLGPMRGAQENGALGFVKGTITGIIGLPVKPVAGIFDFASRASQGVRNRSRRHGRSMRRVRRPRVFGRYNELKCYKEADAIAYDLLKKTAGGKLSGEKIVFYNEVIQSVAASELTREARDRRKNETLKERTASLRRSLLEHEDARDGGTDQSQRKLLYEVTFHQKKLGLELETDFYCENVTIKGFDEQLRHHLIVETPLGPDQEVLQEGDVLVRVGGVDVRGIGFHETLAMLRGTTRPIKLQFESAEEHFATRVESTRRLASTMTTPKLAVEEEQQAAKLRVQLTHWLIVTEERALYINVGSLSNPVVEWMTPLRYIYRVEWVRGAQICLHLSVGVDSLPTGPRHRPTLKALEVQERDMHVFLDVMWLSFGSTTAEEQELWPSDTSLNGYLLKKGGFSTVRRWFVLSRNCLYYFSHRKELRGIIPLGNVALQTDTGGDTLAIRITHTDPSKPLVTLQMDNGQVTQKPQSAIVLVAPTPQEFEMWQSSLAHAAGRGLRHSRGTRFYVPTDASRLEIGCRDTPDFVVAPLVEALRRAVEVFNTKLA